MSYETKEKLNLFLSRNDVRFNLPGRNPHVYVGKDVLRDRQYRTKKYLLWTYQELIGLLQTEDDDEELSSITCSTLYRYVSPKKNTLVGARFHRLTVYAQIVKMLSCYVKESTNAVKIWRSQLNAMI